MLYVDCFVKFFVHQFAFTLIYKITQNSQTNAEKLPIMKLQKKNPKQRKSVSRFLVFSSLVVWI